MNDLDLLRYPIGKFILPKTLVMDELLEDIKVIESFHEKLEKEVKHLNEDQLNTPYRPDGWTIRQVVHHCSDSHMHSLIRLKFALTQDNPIIQPYPESLWAELPDSKFMEIRPALKMIKGIHARWSFLLRSLNEKQWQRSFIHPEHNMEFKLYQSTAMYVWHCAHHLAHITQLKKRMSWK